MKLKGFIIAAGILCCVSCIDKNKQFGGGLIPIEQTYEVFTNDSLFLDDISLKMTDSLSGFSQNRITIGAIRDEKYGLTTRSCALTLVPVFDKNAGITIGNNPKFKKFRFSAERDTVSVEDQHQNYILQNIRVYELEKAIDPTKDFSCTSEIKHKDAIITSGTPVYNGGDSLKFNFTREFAEKYLTITNDDLKDIDTYLKKFPGIYIETDFPEKNGGRIDMFKLQLSYESSYQFISGNFARLDYEAEFNGERKDTSIMFFYSPTKFHDLDSLFTNSATGSFPQYCLNLTGHDTKKMEAEKAGEEIVIEGGGGIKPVISAKYLKHLAEEEIASHGGDPRHTVINKASLIFPYEFPDDYRIVDNMWPDYLSPTCRIRTNGNVSYMNLTDSSSSEENQGDINRSIFNYAPDITYHMQELLKIDESDKSSTKTKKLDNGEYDIWLLIMANEIVTTATGSDSDMSEYYNYLAYQSYYNSMYGGYGGYGGYGYGGYGGYDPYSNYYTYMMLAQYASTSTTSTSYSVMLDKDRYYKASLNGPEFANRSRRPRLELVYSIPNKEK